MIHYEFMIYNYTCELTFFSFNIEYQPMFTTEQIASRRSQILLFTYLIPTRNYIQVQTLQ